MKRRTFVKASTAFLASPFLLHGMRVRALGNPLNYGTASNDRVLVIIQLEGGNDGLNMVIPVEDAAYYKARPTLGISKESALPLAGEPLLRLHPAMAGMQQLFDQGTAAIVENIGYPGMILSHFTGTEIWNTASGRSFDQFLTSGWIGRYLKTEYPNYPSVLPSDPPAIEISPSTSSLFTVPGASIGMSLTDPEEFYALVNGGPVVGDDVAPDDRSGREWNYIDSINHQSQVYSDVVRTAANRAANKAVYPSGNALAESLAIIARLIAGGLGTRIYKVKLGGFDTHTGQAAPHQKLLGTLSDAIKAFQDDLFALKVDERVVGMTYSEFGRRVSENGSGTDHGTAAPHFVFGSLVNGGRIFGGLPSPGDLDQYGNLTPVVDFRCYYNSVFAPFFTLDPAAVQLVLPIHPCEQSEILPLYRPSGIVGSFYNASALTISAGPNPARDAVRLTLHAPSRERITIALYDTRGTRIRVLFSDVLDRGEAKISCDLMAIPAGEYIIAAENLRTTAQTRLVILK